MTPASASAPCPWARRWWPVCWPTTSCAIAGADGRAGNACWPFPVLTLREPMFDEIFLCIGKGVRSVRQLAHAG